jgi:hypothetical protein
VVAWRDGDIDPERRQPLSLDVHIRDLEAERDAVVRTLSRRCARRVERILHEAACGDTEVTGSTC